MQSGAGNEEGAMWGFIVHCGKLELSTFRDLSKTTEYNGKFASVIPTGGEEAGIFI